MERASSSSTSSSSSSSPAAPPGEPFPAALMGKRVQLVVRRHNISLQGTVKFVAEEVCLKVVRPNNPRLRVGHSAVLTAEGGGRWSGKVSWVQNEYLDHHHPGLYDMVWVRMETSPANEVLPESAKNALVMVNSVRRPHEFPPRVKASLNVNQTNESSQAMVKVDLKATATPVRVKVGVNGFGDIERLVIDMAVQSLNMEVVAIYSPESPENMVKVWTSPNVSIAVKDDHTVIFKKRYYELSEKDVKKNEKRKRIFIKSEQMEATVFSKPDQAGWEKVSADFVVDCGICFNSVKDAQSNDLVQFQMQVPDNKESFHYCLKFLPQALCLRELYFYDPVMRDQMKKGDQATSRETAAKDVSHNYKKISPDSISDLPSLSFVATTVFLKEPEDEDMSRDPKMSNPVLRVTLEKYENCSGSDGIHARSCATYEEVRERLIAIMSLCLDIVRYMPVAGCRLKF